MIELNSYTLAGHGYFWPAGDTFSVPYAANSNGTIYLLQSGMGATWTSTNKIGQ